MPAYEIQYDYEGWSAKRRAEQQKQAIKSNAALRQRLARGKR